MQIQIVLGRAGVDGPVIGQAEASIGGDPAGALDGVVEIDERHILIIAIDLVILAVAQRKDAAAFQRHHAVVGAADLQGGPVALRIELDRPLIVDRRRQIIRGGEDEGRAVRDRKLALHVDLRRVNGGVDGADAAAGQQIAAHHQRRPKNLAVFQVQGLTARHADGSPDHSRVLQGDIAAILQQLGAGALVQRHAVQRQPAGAGRLDRPVIGDGHIANREAIRAIGVDRRPIFVEQRKVAALDQSGAGNRRNIVEHRAGAIAGNAVFAIADVGHDDIAGRHGSLDVQDRLVADRIEINFAGIGDGPGQRQTLPVAILDHDMRSGRNGERRRRAVERVAGGHFERPATACIQRSAFDGHAGEIDIGHRRQGHQWPDAQRHRRLQNRSAGADLAAARLIERHAVQRQPAGAGRLDRPVIGDGHGGKAQGIGAIRVDHARLAILEAQTGAPAVVVAGDQAGARNGVVDIVEIDEQATWNVLNPGRRVIGAKIAERHRSAARELDIAGDDDGRGGGLRIPIDRPRDKIDCALIDDVVVEIDDAVRRFRAGGSLGLARDDGRVAGGDVAGEAVAEPVRGIVPEVVIVRRGVVGAGPGPGDGRIWVVLQLRATADVLAQRQFAGRHGRGLIELQAVGRAALVDGRDIVVGAGSAGDGDGRIRLVVWQEFQVDRVVDAEAADRRVHAGGGADGEGRGGAFEFEARARRDRAVQRQFGRGGDVQAAASLDGAVDRQRSAGRSNCAVVDDGAGNRAGALHGRTGIDGEISGACPARRTCFDHAGAVHGQGRSGIHDDAVGGLNQAAVARRYRAGRVNGEGRRHGPGGPRSCDHRRGRRSAAVGADGVEFAAAGRGSAADGGAAALDQQRPPAAIGTDVQAVDGPDGAAVAHRQIAVAEVADGDPARGRPRRPRALDIGRAGDGERIAADRHRRVGERDRREGFERRHAAGNGHGDVARRILGQLNLVRRKRHVERIGPAAAVDGVSSRRVGDPVVERRAVVFIVAGAAQRVIVGRAGRIDDEALDLGAAVGIGDRVVDFDARIGASVRPRQRVNLVERSQARHGDVGADLDAVRVQEFEMDLIVVGIGEDGVIVRAGVGIVNIGGGELIRGAGEIERRGRRLRRR